MRCPEGQTETDQSNHKKIKSMQERYDHRHQQYDNVEHNNLIQNVPQFQG